MKILQQYVSFRPPHSGYVHIHADLSVFYRAVSEAVRMDVSDAAIKELGRWESKQFQVYVCPNLFF